MSWRDAYACIALGLLACQQQRSACDDLVKKSPDGVILSKDESRCEELLEFAKVVGEKYKMDFSTWLMTVPGQRVLMVNDAMVSLTKSGAQPRSFSMEPASVPCGPGLVTSDASWAASSLSSILAARPDRLYVSLSMDITGNTATIRAYQDFDCDKQLGVQELVGEFHPGLDPIAGGWNLISSQLPEIDE